jgi:hypothetical protein
VVLAIPRIHLLLLLGQGGFKDGDHYTGSEIHENVEIYKYASSGGRDIQRHIRTLTENDTIGFESK